MEYNPMIYKIKNNKFPVPWMAWSDQKFWGKKMLFNDKRLATFLRLRWKKPRSGLKKKKKCG
jgi:hypothetical protein